MPYSRSYQPRRSLPSIAAVIALHAVLLWAIFSGLGRVVVELTANTVEATLLAADKPAAAPPPPAPKTPPPPTPPKVTTPAPLPTPTATDHPTLTTAAAPIANSAPAAPAAVRTAPSSKPSGNCEEPVYPMASKRMDEEGVVILKFLIGVDGKVKEALTDKSSGYPRLDNAAKNALSKCQFRPGTVNGHPEESWANIRYEWRLD
jgi:periplasmic protein TonB